MPGGYALRVKSLRPIACLLRVITAGYGQQPAINSCQFLSGIPAMIEPMSTYGRLFNGG